MSTPTYSHMNCSVVFNKTKDAVLFCKRMNDPYEGCLNFVGGKVEQGESSIDAAYRELQLPFHGHHILSSGICT